MSVASILLRVLLSLSLVLYGTGTAVAGARMQLHHAQNVAPAVLDLHAAADAPACHDAGSSAALAEPGLDIQQQDRPTVPPEATPDCCAGEMCDCACAPLGSLLTTSRVIKPAVFDNGSSLHPLAMGHPAPALPDLMRPPIG